MHICFCSPDWPPSAAANGIVSYTAAMRDHLVAQGHEVSVLSHSQIYRSDGSSVALATGKPAGGVLGWLGSRLGERLTRNRGDMPVVGRMVAAQVRAAQRVAPIDIVEMEESFGWSAIVQREVDVPVVTRLHGPYFLNPSGPRTPREKRADDQRCRAEGRAVRSARSLTAPTQAIMDAACARYQRPPAVRSAVIANPVALSPPEKRWSLETCDPDHILMVGRFDYRKGADTMLAAFSRLVAIRPGARLTFVGPDIGIDEAAGRRVQFDDFVHAHLSPEARQRVYFLGRRSPDEVAALRRRAFVTVVASRYEIFPYALLEGFAAGCPMISTDWPGSAEIIVDGANGLMTRVDAPEALADLLDWILARPGEAARLAENGWRRCQSAFSVDAVGSQMLDFYRETLEDSRT